jgi:Rrf2 family iron-sulfur cluster assembly transcriptional regulator
MLSRTSQHAVRAVLELARVAPPAPPLSTARIAASLQVPANYLSKILHSLVRSGLLVSERGASGGFRLSRSPEQITLAEVVSPFQDLGRGRRCLLGRPECRDATACPVHDAWEDLANAVDQFFGETTLASLALPADETVENPLLRR